MMSQPRFLRCQSTTPYLFVGVIAVTTGVVVYRNTIKTTTPSFLLGRRQHQRRSISQINMFGGGEGTYVPAKNTTTATVIFLHGLGDTGDGWKPAFEPNPFDQIDVILPTAPTTPVTLNMGLRCPSWFDLIGLDEDAHEDKPGISASVARINRIIDDQVTKGIPPERIVVAGFSQGGALALTSALQSERKLAGVIGLSTWLPLRGEYPALLSSGAEETEIFMGHGTADQVVSFGFGQKSADIIKQLGRNITFKSYPGLTHSASPEEISDITEFINRCLPPQ